MNFLQDQMSNHLNKEVKENISKLRQIEWADKPGRYLAWQMKKKRKKLTGLMKKGKYGRPKWHKE